MTTFYRVLLPYSTCILDYEKDKDVIGKSTSTTGATLLDPPKSLRFTQNTQTTSLSFEWEPPDGNTTGYRVELFDQNRLEVNGF